MDFEWDLDKAQSNLDRHGVSFDARELFVSDRPFLELHDEHHSTDEERFIAIGTIRKGIAVIIWTQRHEDTIRIISARQATKKEETLYFRYMESIA